MTERYSKLAPLDQEERAALCIMLCSFFSPMNNAKHRQALLLPIEEGMMRPLSLFDFFKWTKMNGNDLWSKEFRINELVLRLEQKGVLVNAGTNGKSPGLSNCFYFMYEFSSLAGKGRLWLGSILGADYIGYEIKKDLVLITGITPMGDHAIGTGHLILPGVVLTCAHVLDDMKIAEQVEIGIRKFKVDKCLSSKNADVGIIFLEEQVAPSLQDIALRSAHSLEEVVIAGYPTIPRGLAPIITLHRGEICGRVENTIDGCPLELFSAIARPGNSGGPVVGLDGRIVGIVTRSLERPREEADPMAPLPFFSAVPADVIQKEFINLTGGNQLPWETYQ